MLRTLIVLALSLALASTAFAAQPYHLQLSANPAAAFPYLGRFGKVDLHVYSSGVRADALWLKGFSRNGAPAVTVANPLGRMYVDVPVVDIAPILTKLAGAAGTTERTAAPELGPSTKGAVRGVAATRHRLVYGPTAWIDVWTTTVVPENPQLKRIVSQLVSGISPATADVARNLPGTPIYIELNFRRFKNVPLLTLEKLTLTADEEKDALELGPLYVRAGVLEKVLSTK